MAQGSPHIAKNIPLARNSNPRLVASNGLARQSIRQIETIAMCKFQLELVKRGFYKSDLLP